MQSKKLKYTRYDMGITVMNLQTMVSLARCGKVLMLFHPNIGVKPRGMAKIQHAATTDHECVGPTVFLYLIKRTHQENT